MALTAIAEVAMDKLYALLKAQSDKADLFITEFSNKTSEGLINVLDELKTQNPLKYQILSDNFRKIADAVESHLAPKRTGGRKKRTTRRRKHRGSK